ncbi:hypothetical protein [Streptomyces sp. NPDC057413]|uniref:hypothetical protein n=1 Tax=Streptomyces sp. NPDC057413 TaxID=3346124 RepID=UPI0036A953A8
MSDTDGLDASRGNPERTRRHLESMASMASAEADAHAAHLRNLEAKGVPIPASKRIAMGYAANARKAATILGTVPEQEEPKSLPDDLTPEQRMARGYGA